MKNKKTKQASLFDWKRVYSTLNHLEKQAEWAFDRIRKEWVKEVQKNMYGFMKKIEKNPVTGMAKTLARTNGHKLLAILDFPTKKEVAKLNHRLNQLEKKMKSLQ